MRLKTSRALFLVENVDLEMATGVEGARWEPFQLAHLNDDRTFRIEDKARQIAWSWLIAAEGVADAMLDKRDSIYVSINHEEAKEKIRYARAVIEAMRPDIRPKLRGDSVMGIEFPNGARLSSLPARPPRGRARSNVYLDEYAHTQRDRAIYTAALPVISKGGRLRIGSSPLGARGQFWEIFNQKIRPYPGYYRKHTSWWETFSMCRDVFKAVVECPGLTTPERVYRFGNRRLQTIYENMPEEDFKQEYEGEFVDESNAWITWEEIFAAQDEDLFHLSAKGMNNRIDEATYLVDLVLQAIRVGDIENVLAAGVDIGRTRNTTEIFIVGTTSTKQFPLRVAITLDNCDFDSQLEVMVKIMSTLPITLMLIDRNGIGMNIAEKMGKLFPTKAQGVDFTNASKKLWATDAKMLIQQRKTPLPVNRDTAYQIHSIKRVVSSSKNLIFDTERNAKHHADRFWAWSLALAAAGTPVRTIKLGFI